MKNEVALTALVSTSIKHVQAQIELMLKTDPNDITKPWLYLMEWLGLVAPHMVNVLAKLSDTHRHTTLKSIAVSGMQLHIPTAVQFDPVVCAQLHERFMPSATAKPYPVEVQGLMDDIQSLCNAIESDGFTLELNQRYNQIQMRWAQFKLQAHALIGTGKQPNDAHDYYHEVMPLYRKLVHTVNRCI